MALGRIFGRRAAIMLAGTLGATVLAVPSARAQEPGSRDEPRPAAGGEIFYSSDSDDSQVVRATVDLDLRNDGPRNRIGVRVEKAWYDPTGTGTIRRNRLFLSAADTMAVWRWEARVGTDGHNVIGSAALIDESPHRKEFFIERDVIETREGLRRGLYSTFVGGALDVPLDDRNTLTGLIGLQEFTGDNLRLHLRGSFVHVLDPNLGLGAQLRGRYFRNSEPREFDYYSPRYFAQILPVLQVRRFIGGWGLLGAGGIGVQRDSASGWRRSDFAQFRVTSPANQHDWSVLGELTYSSAPSNTAVESDGYSYVQTRIGASKRF